MAGDILQFLAEPPTDNPDQKPADLYAEKNVVDFLAQPDPLPSAVEKGLVTPPDQAANVIRLQAKTGLPQGVIERNMDYVEAESNKQGFNATEFRKNNPKLADWMAQDKNHVAVSKTDIEGMSAIEKSWEMVAGAGKAFAASGPRFNAGAWGVLGETLDILGLGNTELAKEAWGASGRQTKLAESLHAGETSFVGKAVGSGFESVGTTLLTYPFAVGRNMNAALAVMGAQTAGISFQKGKEAGKDPYTNLLFGLSQGGVEAATEKISLGRFLIDLNAGSPFWKVLRNQILTENAGEQIATIAQDFNEWAVLHPEKPFADYINERPEAALSTFIATAVGVGLQTGVMHGAYKIAERQDSALIAQRRSEFLQSLGENLNGSTILTKSPESVKSYIEHLKKDGDIQNVYIPVEAWDKLFQMDSAKAAREILGSDQYDEARAVNGDIIIPLETYAEKIAGTSFHDQLMPDITFHPGEMSQRAAEEASKTIDKEVETEAKSIEDSYKANDPVRKVYNDVLGQMLGMKATRQEAERVATLESQRQAARAARLGVDPYELWQERPKTIRREMPAVLRNKEVDIHLDPLLDQLRSGKGATQKEIFGASLTEFLKDKGGLLDQGTELSTMDVDIERKRSAKKLVQKEGMTLDHAAELAAEQGYIDEADINKLLDAIDREIRGEPIYVPGKENQDLLNRDKELNDLNDYLNSIGADLKTMDNAAVRKLVKEHEAKSDLYQASNQKYPMRDEIIQILRDHPLIKLTGKVQRVFVVGSFARNEVDSQLPYKSDVDILLEVKPKNGVSASELENDYREKLQSYFMKNNIRGQRDDVHPQWQGRRVDVYFTYDADSETRPKHELTNQADSLYQTQAQTDTPAFKAWAGTDKPVIEPDEINDTDFRGEGPFVMRVYHGTTHSFEEFNASIKGNMEGQFGAVNYFTSSSSDASDNYAGEGPDLTSRIEQRAERLADEIKDAYDEAGGESNDAEAVEAIKEKYGEDVYDEDMMDMARNIVRKDLHGGDEKVMELFVKTENPFVIGGDKPTSFDLYDREAIRTDAEEQIADEEGITVEELKKNEDEYYDKVSEREWEILDTTENPLADAIQSVAGRYDDVKPDELFGALYELTADGDVKHTDLEKLLRENEGFMYATDEKGDLAQSQIIGEVLQELGFDSIILKDAGSRFKNMNIGGGVAHVHVFDANNTNIKSATDNRGTFDPNDPNILMQTEFNAPSGSTSVPPLTGLPEDALGMYSRTENVITLLKKANPSTVLHELGHSWLEELRLDAMREGAPQQLIDDWNTVKTWAKIEDTISVDSHEQFARGIEAYVMEGKSPSVELQTVFSRFKDWLVRIYKQITALGVEVSPEVREVFDRMLATDEQIAIARDIQGYTKPLLDEAGMTKAEYQAYQRINEKAKVEAEDATRAKVMGELLREQAAWWRNARTAMREEVSAEIDAIPTYRALSWLRKGVFPDGSTLEGIEPMKLSKDALVQRYGAPFLASLPKPYIYQAEGGLHPDVAAEYLGFDTGEELVKALAEAKPRGELIDAETDQRMKAKYGDMMIDGTIADEADFQVNNDRQSEVFMYEMKVLKRRGSTRNISPKEVFQQIARSVIQDKKVADLDPRYYEHAARKAGQEAEKALLGKDMKMGVARNLDLAFDAKQRQLLNLYLFKEAFLAKANIDSAQDRFLDMFKRDEKLAKTRNMDMVNAARAISAQHGIGGSDQNAMAYLEQMREYDPQTYDDMKMVVDLATSDSKPFKQLTVAEFGLVQDSIDGLWELSRLSQQIIIEGKKLQLKTVIAELNGKMELMGEPKAKRGYDKAVTKWEKTKIGLLGAKSALRRVEPWVDAMDQGNFNGEFRRYIWQPISDATTHFREMRRQTLEKYLDLVKPIEGTITRDKIAAPELGYTFGNDGSGRSELLGALLHTGNESNLQKLLRGRNWGEYREDGSLDTSKWDAFIQRMHSEKILTKRDWDFVQSIWDLNESLKPDAQKAHKAMYGYYFEEITAQPLQTPFGEYKGGYMPAIVDPFIADDAALRTDKEALESQSNSFMFPTTGRGFTKSRKAGYAKPLMMDLRYIPSHLDKVLKFTYIEPHVKEVGRLVMNKEFRAGLADYVDTEVASQMLVPWLQRAARQTVETASMDRSGRLFDKFWKEVRSRTGLQIMTLNVTNALQQFTGLSIAAIKVKPSFLAPALARYVRGPHDYASHISEKSEFMRNRVYSQSFEIQEKIDNILLDPTKTEKARDFAVKHGYFLQAGTQHVVDIITWGGAYEQAIADGTDEQVAVKMADSAVRETQGTFAAEDISRFETGSPFMRAFTMFYTYFNMQANLLGTEFSKAMKQGGFGGASRGLYVYTMGFMIPAVISELIVQAMSGKLTDNEDEDWLDWLAIFFGGQGRTVTAMLPGVGPAVQTGINAFNDKWYDDRMSTSPAVAMIESTVHAPYSIYKATMEDGSQKKAIKDTLTAIGMATGLPLAPLGRPLGYLADIEQGRAEPTSSIDLTRGLITGKAQ